LDAQVQLDIDGWRALAGGAPLVEWRLEHEGEPVGEWAHLYQLVMNQPSRVQVSPDPEATEWHWITGARATREQNADTLVLRVTPRGRASPSEASLRVDWVDRLRLSPPPPPEPAACVSDDDLLERVRRGDAYARYVSPRAGRFHFDLEPSPPDHKLAEVVFPITPCANTCLFGAAAVRATAEESDGIDLEVHALELPIRTLVHSIHVPAGGEERRFEVALDRWAGREILLRIGTLPSESWANDFAKIVRPRLGTCRARRELASELGTGVSVKDGEAMADGVDVVAGSEGALLRMPRTAVHGTCLSTGVEVDGEEGAVFASIRVRDGGVEHVVHAREVGAADGAVLIDPVSLFDFTTRDVEIVIELTPLSDDTTSRLIHPRVHACGDAP
jgi:hypothetical protein